VIPYVYVVVVHETNEFIAAYDTRDYADVEGKTYYRVRTETLIR
jgi:hypothetical protein